MQTWKAHYKDAHHDTDIDIINNPENAGTKNDTLCFCIDGYKFVGSSIDSFELKDTSEAQSASEKFSFLKTGGYNSLIKSNIPYSYCLQEYSLDIKIPVGVTDNKTGNTFTGYLYISYEYTPPDEKNHGGRYCCDDSYSYWDNITINEFSLKIDDKIFYSEKKTIDFEYPLIELNKKIQPDYSLRCCFSCQYSDYSPYGNDSFGTMMCFRQCKHKYLEAKDKYDLFELENYEIRQETDLCPEYEPRIKSGGYRGFI